MPRGIPTASVKQEFHVPRWSAGTRLAFRFCFVYFGLYSLATQIFGGVFLFPNFSFPALGTIWPMRQITLWCAEHIFRVTSPLLYTGNSGDTVFHWVQTSWLLVLAGIVTAAWSWLDRARHDYATLHKWFRLFMRFGLAAQMFYYGMAKIIPTQFPRPSLVTLVEPVGNFSLSDLLWTFIGASTPYQIVTGCAEMLAGLLLLTPRTTTLGALIALMDMLQVFVLNMTYDFGLKQMSFHLILMSLFLLAPELRRLANVLLLDRPAGPSAQPQLFATRRANRIAVAVQIVFGIYLVAMFTSLSLRYWYGEGGGGSPRSPLYGIWNIDQMSIDGQVRPPLLNDYDRRWRRVIFDSPDVMVFQRTDDSFAHYGVSLDVDSRRLLLTKGNSRNWGATFTFERPAQDELILEGDMDNHKIRMRLQLVELDTFRLLNSSFRWVHPPDPFAG
jgi:hypothetical protein